MALTVESSTRAPPGQYFPVSLKKLQEIDSNTGFVGISSTNPYLTLSPIAIEYKNVVLFFSKTLDNWYLDLYCMKKGSTRFTYHANLGKVELNKNTAKKKLLWALSEYQKLEKAGELHKIL